MKKTGSMLYIMICLLLCLLPFAGMPFAKTTTTTENRRLAEKPVLVEDGVWNRDYIREWGDWFEDHFAFRSFFVTADSVIQSKVFHVSNMDSVIVGSDGWLYYTSTLSDYLGGDTLSKRGIWNIAHNLSLIQESVEERGTVFLFTVAPNKNSLYGGHMPYYDAYRVSDVKNMTILEPELAEWKISYADLFSEFEREKEVLYLKQDSHWNQKGAVLAYNTMLDILQVEHENFETVDSVRTRDSYGDLNQMLYPIPMNPEWNYTYQKDTSYHYVTDTDSVEDAWIETQNTAGQGSLLMFRDSFGNTLLPLMADTFERGYFSKGTPYQLESYLEQYHPSYVIVEKVERNVDDFAKEPPLLSGPEITLEQMDTEISGSAETVSDRAADESATHKTWSLHRSEYDTAYWELRGTLEGVYGLDTRIYIRITDSDESHTYEAFTVTSDETDYGYLLYLAKDQLPEKEVLVEILTQTDGVLQLEGCRNVDVGMADTEPGE